MIETNRQAAERWIAENPKVMALFRRFAQQLLAARRDFSFYLIKERVRWEFAVDTTLDDGFKINDHYVPYIARAMAREMPELADLIKTRRLRAANNPRRRVVLAQRVDPLTEEPIPESL